MLNKKAKLAAAVISNCVVPSRRLEYIKSLQKAGIPVHVYGLCGPHKCKDDGQDQKRPRICYEELSAKYMFYLAFENAFCTDYVSEKLYQALLYPWVPVVRGAVNYTGLLSEKIAVDASDMSPAELAAELNKIASNITLYAQYFQWRRRYEQTIPEYRQVDTCQICKKLRETKESRRKATGQKWYHSLYNWWWKDSGCVHYSPATVLSTSF